MPSTDSGVPEKVDAMSSEQVVGMARNEWTASIGIDGRHGPEHAGDKTQYRKTCYAVYRRITEAASRRFLAFQYWPKMTVLMVKTCVCNRFRAL
jgi:hypothetical protein